MKLLLLDQFCVDFVSIVFGNVEGKLTAEEWVLMRQHPAHALRMLEPISFLSRALEVPYSHHERWDGTGYPQGLKGEAIPFWARIFSIVDVWDALRSNRPYHLPMPDDDVRVYLRQQSGTQFDPQVVDAFLAISNDEWEKIT